MLSFELVPTINLIQKTGIRVYLNHTLFFKIQTHRQKVAKAKGCGVLKALINKSSNTWCALSNQTQREEEKGSYLGDCMRASLSAPD